MAEPSRVEQILKSMLGLADNIPKPQSRVEELLIDLKQAIEGSGGDTTELVNRISAAEQEINGIKIVDKAQNAVIEELGEEKADKSSVDTLMAELKNAILEELLGYVKKTDYATNSNPGIVSMTSADVSRTIGVNSTDGSIYCRMASADEIKNESTQYRLLNPLSIPIFMLNYGIESKTQIVEMNRLIADTVNGGTKNLLPINDFTTYLSSGRKEIILPESLPEGRYNLSLEITDVENGVEVNTIAIVFYDENNNISVDSSMWTPGLNTRFNTTYNANKSIKRILIYGDRSIQLSQTHRTTFANVMLCREDVYKFNKEYVPYAMSNVELTKRIEALENTPSDSQIMTLPVTELDKTIKV